MIHYLYRAVFVLLIFKLLMTLYQRRFNQNGGMKRMASLQQSVLIGFLYAVITVVRSKGVSEVVIYAATIAVVIVGFLRREKLFPYKTRCISCNKRLKITQILFIDSQLCQQCEN